MLDSCRWLSERGFKITYLPVQKNGLVDLNVLESAITDKTCLVSVMGVNNEIGVVQPLKEIGAEYGDRNHSTVLSSIRKVEEMIKEDPMYSAAVRDITSNINSQ